VHVPLIRHEVLVDAAAVRAARERLAAHRGDRWLAVTSATTVSVIASSLAAAGGGPGAAPGGGGGGGPPPGGGGGARPQPVWPPPKLGR